MIKNKSGRQNVMNFLLIEEKRQIGNEIVHQSKNGKWSRIDNRIVCITYLCRVNSYFTRVELHLNSSLFRYPVILNIQKRNRHYLWILAGN